MSTNELRDLAARWTGTGLAPDENKRLHDWVRGSGLDVNELARALAIDTKAASVLRWSACGSATS